uniref:PHD-type domain-containing protein n=1 Tax=Mola mola TaxID=94237 RepID=A0A3Q3XBM2_MOLML
MHCGHVAIHADTGHEADAHVDVGKEQDPGDAAGDIPKHPVVLVDVIVHPEGQSAQDDDVCQSQVADVHAEGCARSRPEDEDDEAVITFILKKKMDKSANAEDGEAGDSDKCYICLSPFENQAVASLKSCQHVFCLHCILQWSQVNMHTFVKKINKKPYHFGNIKWKEAVICEACGRSDRRHRLLVCVHCDSGYHTDCLTPALNTGPEGDWICPECATQQCLLFF